MWLILRSVGHFKDASTLDPIVQLGRTCSGSPLKTWPGGRPERHRHSLSSLFNMTRRMKGFSVCVDQCVPSPHWSFSTASGFYCFGIYCKIRGVVFYPECAYKIISPHISHIFFFYLSDSERVGSWRSLSANGLIFTFNPEQLIESAFMCHIHAASYPSRHPIMKVEPIWSTHSSLLLYNPL